MHYTEDSLPIRFHGAFVVERVPCKTIFIDTQIQLMKLFVKEDESSWREFIHRNFMVPIADFHRRHNTVIVCFDNYLNILLDTYSDTTNVEYTLSCTRPSKISPNGVGVLNPSEKYTC